LATPLNSNSRIIVIGCSGAVGSQLISILKERGFEILGIRFKGRCYEQNHVCQSVDLLDPHANLDFSDFCASSIILTSWITTPLVFWDSRINEEWFEASRRLITQFIQTGGAYVAVTGTCAEYDWSLNRPLKEADFSDPTSLYGQSKLKLLNWLTDLGIPFLWTRTFAQFGLSEPTGRLVPSVIDSLLKCEVAKITNANGVRDFIFVEDIARILSFLLSSNQVGVVNIGTGVGIKIGDMAMRIGNVIGRPQLVNITDDRSEGDIVVADTTRLNELLGSFAWTSLEDALSRSIETRQQNLKMSKPFHSFTH